MSERQLRQQEIVSAQRFLARLPSRMLIQLLVEVGSAGVYSRIASAMIRSELRSREFRDLGLISRAISAVPTAV